MKFVLKKKKKFLKPKQIYILYTEKPQKEKKWKEMKFWGPIEPCVQTVLEEAKPNI